MLPSLLALFPMLAAAEADLERTVVWDLTLDGQPVGERTLIVRYQDEEAGGLRRVLEAYTDADGSPAGIDYRYRERITAHATTGPAAFHAVVQLGGASREVQARRGAASWRVTVVERGQERTFDVAASHIDLSTADLIDPSSRVHISRFDRARVLSVETGEIWEGRVTRLGPRDLRIGEATVTADGFAWKPPQGRATLHYTYDGYLVRYELQVAGRTLVGTLREPPPGGVDASPVPLRGIGVRELEVDL